MIQSVLHRGVAFTLATVGLAIAILATLLPGAAFAVGAWKTQPSGTSVSLYSVAFPDPTLGWAVGDAGTILATSDGGATWSAQDSGTEAALKGVAFPDATLGWVVGTSQDALGNVGGIYATTDGGTSWTRQAEYHGTYYDFVSVAFPDTTHGWVVGGRGIDVDSPGIFPTSDGGAEWTTQTSDTADDLNSVAFTDSTHGWAVGNGGTIFGTADGGTWAAQASDTEEDLRSVAFLDRVHGWAVGDNGTIVAYETAAPALAVRAMPIAAVVVVLGIVGGLALVLTARQRRARSDVGTADLSPSRPGLPVSVVNRSSMAAEGERVRYCTECGSPVQAASAFCGSCGAKTAR